MIKYFLAAALTIFTLQKSFGQWVQTKGPYGANCFAIATIDSVVFVGVHFDSYGSGIFKSTNYGKDWKNDYNCPGYSLVTSFHIDGIRIFAATERGILFSNDFGESWVKPINNLSNSNISSIIGSDSIILVGTNTGVYKSLDNANTFIASGNGITNPQITSLKENGSNVYAATSDGIFISLDTGSTWVPKNNGILDLNIRSFFVNDTALVAGTMNGTIYYSSDSGNNWSVISQLVDPIKAIELDVSKIYISKSGGIYSSSDNGNTWLPNNSGLTNHDVQSLAVFDTTIYACTYSGTFRSNNSGSNWKLIGIPALDVLAMAQEGNNIYAGTRSGTGNNSGFFISQNNGESWKVITNGLPTPVAVGTICLVGHKVFISSKGGMFVSSDSGSTWMNCSSSITTDSLFETIAQNNGILYAAGRQGNFYCSYDTSQSWNILTPIVSPPTSNLNQTSITFIGSDIFVSTYASPPNNGVFRSTDNGNTWSYHPIIAGTYTTVRTLIVKDSVLFAATDSGIHRSFDRGNTWTPINNGITNYWTYSITSNGSTLFAGTVFDGSIFYSTDNGDNWMCINDGLRDSTDLLIRCLMVTQDYLFAGIGSLIARLSVVRRPLSEITGNHEIENKYSFFKIHPNPATNNLTLSFSENIKNGEVSLLNVVGQEIFRREFSNITSAEIDLSEFKSGIYFVRIVNEKQTHTSKLIIEK